MCVGAWWPPGAALTLSPRCHRARPEGNPNGQGLGNLTVQSIYDTRTTVSQAGRGVRNGGFEVGTLGDSVDLTVGPARHRRFFPCVRTVTVKGRRRAQTRHDGRLRCLA